MAVKYHTYVPKDGTPDAKSIEKIEIIDSGPSSIKGRVWLDEDVAMSWYAPYFAYKSGSGVGEATSLKVDAPTLHDGEVVSPFALKGDKLKLNDALVHLKQAGLVKNAELKHWNYRNPHAPEAEISDRAHRHRRNHRPYRSPVRHTVRTPDVPVADTTPFWMSYINHGMDEQNSKVASVQFYVEPTEEAYPPRGVITFWGGEPGEMERMVRKLNVASDSEGHPWEFRRNKTKEHSYRIEDENDKGEVVEHVNKRPQFDIFFRGSPNQVEPLTSDDMFNFLAQNKLVTSDTWRKYSMPDPTVTPAVFNSPFFDKGR